MEMSSSIIEDFVLINVSNEVVLQRYKTKKRTNIFVGIRNEYQDDKRYQF